MCSKVIKKVLCISDTRKQNEKIESGSDDTSITIPSYLGPDLVLDYQITCQCPGIRLCPLTFQCPATCRCDISIILSLVNYLSSICAPMFLRLQLSFNPLYSLFHLLPCLYPVPSVYPQHESRVPCHFNIPDIARLVRRTSARRPCPCAPCRCGPHK